MLDGGHESHDNLSSDENACLLENFVSVHFIDLFIYSPNRTRKCMLLLRYALKRYSKMREFAYVYDLASTLFTNYPLDLKEVNTFSFVVLLII